MARAGAVLAEVHEVLADAVAPGVTTAELDALAAAEIAARGAQPSFLARRPTIGNTPSRSPRRAPESSPPAPPKPTPSPTSSSPPRPDPGVDHEVGG
ncbi:hypothetical protein OG799_24360 [Micromonospora sp. NBC_00898]|uniref:hypothetical protein n=1 Tax=Micromonospora sp. NBC_00898 TaxID=2975981 RepID=UPI003864180B|nr:hypothetical protein OG799_24360 [Micromonospora sp. NBC_00898]